MCNLPEQCLSPGSMVTFEVVGDKESAFRVLDALEEFIKAVSLGGCLVNGQG